MMHKEESYEDSQWYKKQKCTQEEDNVSSHKVQR